MKVEDLLELKFKEIMDHCDKQKLCDDNMGTCCSLKFICQGKNNSNALLFYEIMERIKENKGKTFKFKSKNKKKTIKDRLEAI